MHFAPQIPVACHSFGLESDRTPFSSTGITQYQSKISLDFCHLCWAHTLFLDTSTHCKPGLTRSKSPPCHHIPKITTQHLACRMSPILYSSSILHPLFDLLGTPFLPCSQERVSSLGKTGRGRKGRLPYADIGHASFITEAAPFIPRTHSSASPPAWHLSMHSANVC